MPRVPWRKNDKQRKPASNSQMQTERLLLPLTRGKPLDMKQWHSLPPPKHAEWGGKKTGWAFGSVLIKGFKACCFWQEQNEAHASLSPCETKAMWTCSMLSGLRPHSVLFKASTSGTHREWSMKASHLWLWILKTWEQGEPRNEGGFGGEKRDVRLGRLQSVDNFWVLIQHSGLIPLLMNGET